MRASTLSTDDETVVMGLAFIKFSTSQRMALKVSSVRVWLSLMAYNHSFTDWINRSQTPPNEEYRRN